MIKINKYLLLWFLFHFMMFIILSYYFNRSMFSDDFDKFYGQMQNIYNGVDLGVLNFFYTIRYYSIYPFFYIEQNYLPKLFEYLLFILYLYPLFFIKKTPIHLRYFSIILLYFSLFFSYRTILVMLSITILVMHIKYINLPKKYILISFLLSFLSSGVFLLWIIILFLYKKDFVENKRFLKIINIFSIIFVFILIGPITHKILFFFNQDKFSGTVSINFMEIFNYIGIQDILIIFKNIFYRSFIYEAYFLDNYFRLLIVIIEFLLSFLLVLLTKNKFVLLLFFLLLLSLLFEGLMIYSLLFPIILINFDLFYRSLSYKRVFHAKNIIS